MNMPTYPGAPGAPQSMQDDSPPDAARRPGMAAVTPSPAIVLVRHGETHWNRSHRYQGQKDSPLTLTGIAQVRAVVAALRRRLGDPAGYRVWSSPLGRTKQTAALLCEEMGLSFAAVTFDDRLMECHYGCWEGLTHDQIRAKYPEDLRDREADPWNHAVPGGESFATVAARVRSWLDEAAPGGPLIVVAHGGSGRVLRGLYLGLEPKAIFAFDEPQSTAFVLADGRETMVSPEAGDLRRFGLEDPGLGVRL